MTSHRIYIILWVCFWLIGCSISSTRGHLDQSSLVSQREIPARFRVLPDSNVSGSGQFTRTQLINAINRVNHHHLPVIVVDLREEPHAFIDNQTPVSFKKSLPFNVNNNYVSEEVLVKSLGYHYFYIPVVDHFPPTSVEIENFLNFYRKVSNHYWLHFHCHGGSGRTTTFLVMVDMINHAHKDSFETILQREHAIGGKDLYHIDLNRPTWFINASQKRLILLKNFYNYMKSESYQRNESWIEYMEK